MEYCGQFPDLSVAFYKTNPCCVSALVYIHSTCCAIYEGRSFNSGTICASIPHGCKMLEEIAINFRGGGGGSNNGTKYYLNPFAV